METSSNKISGHPILERTVNKGQRVAVCVASGEMVHADFAMALAAMMYNPGANCVLINTQGSLVVKNHNNAIEEAKKINADWVLFLDSDMIFPPDALHGLLRRGKYIVGATYTKRGLPYEVLGLPLNNESIKATTGLVEMAALPTGCLLINMQVFAKLKRPYFRIRITEETDSALQSLQDEDYYFCQAARAAGFKIWMDVDLSKMVGHIGSFVYKIKTSEKDDAAEAANPANV